MDSQQSDDVAVLGWDEEITRAMSDRVRGHCWGFSMDSNANFDDGSKSCKRLINVCEKPNTFSILC